MHAIRSHSIWFRWFFFCGGWFEFKSRFIWCVLVCVCSFSMFDTFIRFTHPSNWFRIKFYCDFHSTLVLSYYIGYMAWAYEEEEEKKKQILLPHRFQFILLIDIGKYNTVYICICMSFDSLFCICSTVQMFPVILFISSFDPNKGKLQLRSLKWCLTIICFGILMLVLSLVFSLVMAFHPFSLDSFIYAIRKPGAP